MCDYVEKTFSKKVFLVGSSAGAPLSGAVLDYTPNIVGGAFIGYTWGFWTSIVFGWAFESIRNSPKPKLFIVGDRDEFTSMDQYHSRIAVLRGDLNEMQVIEGKNHFEIESPAFDKPVASWVAAFLKKVMEQ